MNTCEINKAAFRAEMASEAAELSRYWKTRGNHVAEKYFRDEANRQARAADLLLKSALKAR